MDKEEVKSRRQLLEEGWNKLQETDDDEDVSGGDGGSDVRTEATKEPQQEGQGAKEEGRGESSGVASEAKAGEEGKQKVDEAVQQELKASKKIESGKVQQPPALDPSDRAPGAWKPATRELWGQVPKEVREEIRKRELEIERTLTQTGTMRKFATDFATMVAPYSHIIRAQNSTPLQAVDNLMRTAASLASGSPQQKAETIGHIIANYGVDIKMLDDYLTKNYNPATASFNQQQNSAPPQWAQPIFEWMNRAQQSQHQLEQQHRAQADNEISQMESEPFFDDLREDIADIMEFAAKRGKILNIKDAYKQAVQLNPEISKILKQRADAAANNSVSQAASTLAKSKKAAKTLVGAPKQDAGNSNKPKTRREMLSEAWNEAEQ